MEVGTELPIHQTLHGYAEGHTLLAASCELSAAERKRLLLMSDLSGSPVHPAFLSYLTGYPLPGQRYYALARTWYATEMSRPGCVWTQTLLIHVAQLGQLKQLDFLNTLFTRPQQNSYSTYSLPILYHSINDSPNVADLSDELTKLYEQIVDNLYSKPAKKLLIRATAPDWYESILIAVWSHQWPRLRRRFSFCTGAFKPRYIDDAPLDCQIIPDSLTQPAGLRLSNEFIWMEATQSDVESSWVDLMRQAPADQLLYFMYQYGSDVKGMRSRFIPLLYAYKLQSKSQLKTTSFDSLFKFLAKYFPSPEEAKRLKSELIKRKFEQDPVSTYEFVEAWFCSSWVTAIPDLNWDISSLISQIWHSNFYSAGQVSQLLQKVDPSRLTGAEQLSILQSLPIDCWLDSTWIDVPLLTELLKVSPTCGESQLVWNASLQVQKHWIQALESVDLIDWLAINEVMLMAENNKWVSVVVQHTGVQAVFASLFWANRTNRDLSVAWEKVIFEQNTIFFGWLSNQTQLTPYIISLITKLFNIKTLPLASISPGIWAKVARILMVKPSIQYNTEAITLLFTASLIQNELNAIDLVVSFFNPLHERAKVNQLDYNSWYLLKSIEKTRPAAKQSEGLWYMLFAKKGSAPAEWDRCEYIRQITVDYYILYDWPQSAFSRMIVDEDVFIQIVRYCTEFKEGRTYLTTLKYYLEEHNSTTARKQLGLINQAQQNLQKRDKN